MSSNGNTSCYFFLIRKTCGGENHLIKLFSPIKISRNQSKSLPSCCYSFFFITCFIIQCHIISAYLVVLLHSPKCLSAISICIYWLLVKSEMSWKEEFHFPFPNHDISRDWRTFAEEKNFVSLENMSSWEYKCEAGKLQSSLSLLSVMVAANQPISWSCVCFHSESLTKRWVLSNTSINTMHSLNVPQTV